MFFLAVLQGVLMVQNVIIVALAWGRFCGGAARGGKGAWGAGGRASKRSGGGGLGKEHL